MSKTAFNQISPADLVPTFGVDGFRYHFLRDQAFGPDGEFSYEGMVARYNADLANNLGNLLARVSAVVGSKCSGIGPAPRPDSPLAELAEEVYATAAQAWERVAPSEALEATWRLVRAANAALEAAEPWRADPGPAVDAVLGDALEILRIVAVLASPASPGPYRDLAPHRANRLTGGGAAARRLQVGRVPGGLPVESEGAPFPSSVQLAPSCGATTIATFPTKGLASKLSSRPGRRGSPGSLRSGPARSIRLRRCESLRPTTACGPPSGPALRCDQRRCDGWSRSCKASPNWWRWGSAGSTTTTTIPPPGAAAGAFCRPGCAGRQP